MEKQYISRKRKYEEIHIVPLFSALNSSYNGLSKQHLSPCEKPCVCRCVCRHGKASALDFNKKKDLVEKEIEELFAESWVV